MRRAERLRLPGGREVVLGWGEVGREEESALSPLEREGLARCRTDKRRREFVAGRLAAHRALALLEPGARAEVTAREDGPDAGRPLFSPGQGLALSISHSAELAVAAVARGGPLGVDLEQRVEAGGAFLEEAFAPGELEGYRSVCEGHLDPATAAWALKEAVLKVWGVGLRAPLQKVAVRPVLLHAAGGPLSLRVTLETWELPPGLGAPPPALAALLMAWRAGGVLALAGQAQET
ncbi:4'-phosphopantetheinyl transferase superfamily protein [Archangium gephyra]|uniref:4'-phosphopantetheinyl transferase family protein n=1 Tax=Archangium gephyra TaxID=48 RepID=UPI0035D46663